MKKIIFAILIVYSFTLTFHLTTIGYSGDKSATVESN